ncbi:L-carnitine dehydrogenase [Aliiroseovarius zhejiangensis]|uniref:L-carnitine dehydrogenase n=1 Tax=Aliiroseovarius zhejiangensis TaxID=1632025 RepID=A0ABQ3ITR3_9RHOB|nr:carnitine 3-dehydrogenase [Aliiroseovarius zhejiangensis]GHE94291.1 L-carnitine dehydrogenase [Aliiroseovarius zhejiangensis]
MKAAIIGGGVIGGGWAARFLLNGWDVAVFDPDPEAERKISEVLMNARRALPGLYDTALPPEGRLTYHSDLAQSVAGADWVQESVPERLELKHKVLADLMQYAPDEAIIGSSTSGFKPSELNEKGARAIVAHPFNPVYLLPLIELVGDADTCARAADILSGIGMFPLKVRKEIDAHIADRFLEAVWREALWLVKDGIANTEEIDEAIRMGFGLRWAQMGLFETYRVAGGEAGMKHFMAQFGPCLSWPWTKLMDVPEFTDELVDLIADQSDAQSGHMSIRELERLRDDNLVSILRALKARGPGSGAGRVVRDHEADLWHAMTDTTPLRTVARDVPIDWTDYNGHMNEGRYGQVFSDAADRVMAHVGADADYIGSGLSFFTAETNIKYLDECHAGEAVYVDSTVTLGEGKKLRLWHEMRRKADDSLLATCDQFLLHVDLTTRKSCPPRADVEARVETLATLHARGTT